VDAARRIASSLNHSVLAIQGPPGSGKTYTGARMICELIRQKKKVGITAVSHKVIRTFQCFRWKPSGIGIKPYGKDDPRCVCSGSRTDIAHSLPNLSLERTANQQYPSACSESRTNSIRSVMISALIALCDSTIDTKV
jgi:KaiC/GvpD/RAD55 family RecA-like ATPase